MKIYIVLGILILLVVAGCRIKDNVVYNDTLGGTSSKMIAKCPGIYQLDSSLGREIASDQDAFVVLKEGFTYDSTDGQIVEDKIPANTTLEEALGGVLKKDQEIKLDSGETIKVWTIGYNDFKALDKQGNIYLCKFN